MGFITYVCALHMSSLSLLSIALSLSTFDNCTVFSIEKSTLLYFSVSCFFFLLLFFLWCFPNTVSDFYFIRFFDDFYLLRFYLAWDLFRSVAWMLYVEAATLIAGKWSESFYLISLVSFFFSASLFSALLNDFLSYFMWSLTDWYLKYRSAFGSSRALYYLFFSLTFQLVVKPSSLSLLSF